MNTTTAVLDYAKTTGAVLAVAASIFFGYSVVGYVADTFLRADAAGCSTCGGTENPIIVWDGGGGGWSWTHADGGGGGGGSPTPYCTLSIVRGPAVATSYPPQYQYTITWTAPYATQFSINNGIGSVAPPAGGTYQFSSTATSGTYTGTATTPYGTVTCSGEVPPLPPNPPYCVLSASPTTIAVGQSSTITWNTTSGTSFSVNNGVGSLTPVGGGTFVVSPATTTTYIGTVTGSGYQTAQCQTTVTVIPPAECKLEIKKSAIDATLTPGATLTYTIEVKNSGDKKCTGSGVKIQDVLDANLIYQSETHSSNITAGYQSDPLYNTSTRTLSWNAWDLDPSETGWIHLTVKAGTPTACEVNVTNKARITSYEYNNFTTWVYSNAVQNQLKKDCTPPPPEECKLELTKSADTSTTTPNGLVTYTINFKNTGNKKCTGSGVKVQDVLDPMLTYVSETHSSNITAGYQSEPVYKSSTRTLSWNAWDLDPSETGWVKFVAKAGTPTSCTEVIPNKAKVTAYEYNNFNTWVYSNLVNVVVEKDCTPPPQYECELEITKSANVASTTPNGNIEYTINVKNVGGKKCTGSGVKVQDVLDPMLTYVSETHSSNITAGYQSEPVYKSSTRTLSWNAWDLDPSETGWVKFVAKAGTPTSCTEVIPNKAKVTAYEYNNFNTWVYSNLVNVTVTKDCYVQVPYCTMSIDPTSVAPGGPATLSWNTTNVTSASIDQGIGSVALSGSKVVNPSTNTTYTGTFTGPGGTVTCTASITMTQGPAPMCTLSVSASKIKTGQSVMVSWTSQNVTQGTINGIGTTTPVSGGSAEVFPPDSTTYTGTFTGPYGTVTCSAPVEVEKGTTGCSGNCGGGLNQPNVVMLQKPPEAPLAFVTLEQIPYTGFEAGKLLTLIFWLAVGVLAALATYFAMGHRALQFVLGGTLAHDSYEPREAPRPMPSTVRTENHDTHYRERGYAATVASVPRAAVVLPPVAKPATDGIPELTDVIESRAHAAGVLISPEAVELALELSPDRGAVLRQFGEILNEAVRTLPREDGWVMLTSERFESLVGAAAKPVTLATPVSTPSVEAILNSVMPPVVPQAHANVEMPMSDAGDQAVVMSLAKALLSGNRDLAYATVRNLEVGRAHAASVATVVAGAFDQLYRARRHGLTTELSVAALDVTDEKLAKMVELFTHAMDSSYANAFTSLKLAVAQAFEVRVS